MLVPATFNVKPYSALKLDELCAGKKGSEDRLIFPQPSEWKKEAWAKATQSKSEWVLIPKADPGREKVPEEKHFRDKRIFEQEQVHKDYYQDYREAKALEAMTTAL